MDVDNRTMRTILLAHVVRIQGVAARYRGFGIDQDDLVQEGLIGLTKAIGKYDPEVGIPLWGFALVYVRAEMRRAIGRLDGDKGLRKRSEFATDVEALHRHRHLVETRTPEDLCIALEEYEDLDDGIEHLPEREKIVLKLSIAPEALSPPEIGQRLKLCLTSVTSAKTKAIRHLRRDIRFRAPNAKCAEGGPMTRTRKVCRVH